MSHFGNEPGRHVEVEGLVATSREREMDLLRAETARLRGETPRQPSLFNRAWRAFRRVVGSVDLAGPPP
jgi:hypothetical protein